jgi:Tfp pilus assembly protein PilF
VARNPLSAEAHNNLGRALLRLKDVSAAQHFAAALQIDIEYFEAAEGLGTCWFQAGSFDRAAEALAHASRLRPKSIDIRLFLARTYTLARRLDAAEAEYRQLLSDHPDLPEAQCGLATVFAAKGEYDRPRTLFEAALEKRPDDAYLQFQYATWLLRDGAFDRAWNYYESRWRQAHAGWVDAIDRALPASPWQGESLAGKTLLIACEQGLGDEIMFASVLPEIVNAAAHCIVECDARLAALFRRSFPQATVFAVDRKAKEWPRSLESNLHRLPQFDYWVPAGSLPRYRRVSAQDFPQHAGYLVADADRTRYWRMRLAELGAGLKIGISWRGGVPISNTADRSMTLQQLRPFLEIGGVHFVNLQYDAKARQEIGAFTAVSGIPIHHWQEAIDDYDATASLISSLDLVVSVCTSVVHLGGALGRPVWVMAPLVAEWRYGRQGPSMIWYPSVRMFRQPRLADWNPVIADVRRALHDFTGRPG